MTTITIDRTVLEKALEALEYYQHPAEPNTASGAANELRAVLEQSEKAMPSNTRYTVHVEGQPNTYYDNIHDAITYAQRAIYSGIENTTHAIDDLTAGRIAEWSYGFSAVRIYPPEKLHKAQARAGRYAADCLRGDRNEG